jgi:hypothetical protein
MGNEILNDNEKQAIIDYMLAITNLGLKKYFSMDISPNEIPIQEDYAKKAGIAKSTFANKLTVSNVKNLTYNDFIASVVFENKKRRKIRGNNIHHPTNEQFRYVMDFSIEKKKNPRLTIKSFAESIGIKRNTFNGWLYKYGDDVNAYFWSQCNQKCDVLANAIKCLD